MGVSAYSSLVESAAQYDINLLEEWSTVLQNIFAASGGFLAFACILCGIGMILGDLPNNANEPVVSKKRKSKKEVLPNVEAESKTEAIE